MTNCCYTIRNQTNQKLGLRNLLLALNFVVKPKEREIVGTFKKLTFSPNNMVAI